MAISTNRTYEFNVSQIITLAFKTAAIINIEQSCNPEQLKFGKDQLDLMTQALEADGVFARSTELVLVDLVEDQSEYTLPDDVCDIIENAQLLGDSNDTVNGSYYEAVIRRVRIAEWGRIPNKQIRGIPTMFYDERTPTGIKIHLYPVPLFGAALRFQVQRLRARNELAGTPDLERWWADWLVSELAARIATASGFPVGQVQLLQQLADRKYQRCKDKSSQRAPNQMILSHRVRVHTWR